MIDLREAIDQHLLEAASWVPARTLSDLFSVGARQLRRNGPHPGLTTGIAISGDKGYKHILLATSAEFDRWAARKTAHGAAEITDVDRARILRTHAVRHTSRPPLIFERDTGQAIHPSLLTP